MIIENVRIQRRRCRWRHPPPKSAFCPDLAHRPPPHASTGPTNHHTLTLSSRPTLADGSATQVARTHTIESRCSSFHTGLEAIPKQIIVIAAQAIKQNTQ
jgi:hypothetical protein